MPEEEVVAAASPAGAEMVATELRSRILDAVLNVEPVAC